MIKIFRKIRYDLMEQNKIGKYLKYAIGEIVLVVIGILIALSINNWNQNSTDRSKEQNYITSLIEDAKSDLSNFENAITGNNQRLNSLDSLQAMCYNYNTSDNRDPQLIMWYMSSLKRPDFVAQTDRTLAQLKNSGGMRLIEDKSKIDAIITYEESFERLYNQQVWYEGGLKDLVNAGVPILNYSLIPVRPEEYNKEDFLNNARLHNTDNNLMFTLGNRANIYKMLTYSYMNYLEEGKKECLKLIEILKK